LNNVAEPRVQEVLVARQQAARQVWVGRVARFLRRHWVSYAFVAPFMILFAIFTIAPVLTSLYLSFTYFNILEPPRWIGWTNYRLLILEDDIFLIAIKNTLMFAAITGPAGYFGSLLLAWMLNPLRHRVALALAYYVPSITSGVAMAVVWKVLFFGGREGYLNAWLLQLGVLWEPIYWLQDQRTLMPIVIGVSLWASMGTGFLVFLAGLQQVPQELYEAGRIDGIPNALAELWYITLPYIRPQLLFGSVMSIVSSLSVFSVPVALAGLPSPLYAAHTIVAHLYDYSFIRFEMGYGSAIATVLFLFMFLLGRLMFRLLSSKDM